MTRRAMLGLGMAALAGRAGASRAAAYPSRPIELIVPWPAGGATDLTLRILCEEAAPLLGQPLVVINRPGAGGSQVAPLLKAAHADGHTIGQVPITVYRHALMNAVPWNPLTDLSPIVQVSGTTFGVLVPAASPFQRFADLLDWGRANPGRLIVGSTGVGTTAHLAMEEVLQQQGVRYVHVPYRGTADQMLDLASGQVMAGVNSTGFAPWVDQGKVRLLATFGAQRSPRWPEVPTLRELGHPYAVHSSPWGLAAPAGTPEAAVQVLHEAFHKAMFSERHVRELARFDQAIDYLNTRDYRAAVAATVEREKRLLQRMNLLKP
ncbi:tripartite tricarboxylate transporter substrate binding protein [Hydrogenophaga sp.]|uniref:tripartite tricarboxylate transporter substrate binding protein n=1 Tax=unclassified Hydrogenophaga TaxID=2610897 RepID=UPI00257A8B63|nr:tripartite tricarboxylate transporter substrate binding protein [Hydrogenophaga sp.]